MRTRILSDALPWVAWSESAEETAARLRGLDSASLEAMLRRLGDTFGLWVLTDVVEAL